MNEELIIKALGNIDEKYILETDRLRNRKPFHNSFRKAGLIAACLLIAVISLLAFPLVNDHHTGLENGNSMPPNQENTVIDISKEESTESETEIDPSDSHALTPNKETMPETVTPTPELEDDAENEGNLDIESISSFFTGRIESFTENGFICVLSEYGDSIHVICDTDSYSLAVGDTVKIYYSSPDTADPSIIYATNIEKQ